MKEGLSDGNQHVVIHGGMGGGDFTRVEESCFE